MRLKIGQKLKVDELKTPTQSRIMQFIRPKTKLEIKSFDVSQYLKLNDIANETSFHWG